MASSQVEIASSSPFGCVLRDRNHRDGCRESNVKATHAAFQRNIKNFVMDHINTCMSMSSSDSASTNENNNNQCHVNNNNVVSKAPKRNNLEKLHFIRSNHVNINNNETSLASLISPRHSRLLDRWAARQAREMVSNLENEAELLSMDNNNNKSQNNNSNDNNNNNNMLARTISSVSDESRSEVSNLGASSLVQIWEKRLNQSNGSKSMVAERTSPNATSAACSNENVNAASNACSNENVFTAEEQCFDGPSGNDSTFPDWESDKTGQSDQSVSPRSRWCSSESDRVSVADIIKKLTSTSQNQSPSPSFGDENEREECGGGSSVTGSPCRERECGGFTQQEQSEHKAFPQAVACSLRIRGRRAFNDLLMQLEQDRHGELKNLAERGVVSRFTQRGRIQSLLRLRLLQREVAANDPSRQKSTTCSEINKQPQGSAIMQLRERFTKGVETRTTVQAEASNPKSPSREIVNNNTQLDNSPSTDQFSKDTSNQTANATANHSESTKKSVAKTTVDHNREEAHPSSDVISQETSFREQHYSSQETAEASTSMTDSNLNETEDRVEASNQQHAMAKSSYKEAVNEEEASNQNRSETSYKETAEEEEASNQNYAESNYDEIMEEVEDIDQNYDETNYDWISEISRPRSYWEERRQAWYREMLDTDSHNEDIRKLLERRTVSTFLSSDFRERMDRLMQSHRGTQTHLVNSQDDAEDNQGLMAFLQERLHSARTPQEDGREREEEEEEERRNQDEEEEEKADEQEHEHEEEHEGESLVSGSYHEAGDYSNQSSSWSYRDNEAGDDFDRVVSTSSQPYQSQSFYQDSRRYSSSTNHHSIEMELIYDLRGHMEQLYHEISELRKSIKGCMDMQVQLQQSMNQEVHTVKKEEKKSHKKAPKKGNCCICYDMKVDSLLYRCGHMCTCLKCANELQWNSGKCPICRAKIVDVVRVYVDG